MDPGTIRALVIAGGIVLGLGLAYAGLSLLSHRSGEVPVVRADDRPIRVKPDNPGGLQIAGANNDIFSGGSDTDGSKLAPAPEVPDPQALRTQAPAPVAAAVPPAAVAPPVVAPAVVPRAEPAPVPAPAPKVAAVAPAAKPATLAAGGKPVAIQLAALGSEDAARTEWHILQKRMPELLSGHQPVFSKTERAGKTYWRLRTAGFPDAARAKAACEKIRAKGAACSVAEF